MTKPDQIKRSPAKNLLFTVILFVFLFLLIEVVLSVYLYHRKTDENLATVEAVKLIKTIIKGQPNPVNLSNQNLARPDSSEAINKQIAEETHLSNKFEYEPWVEFRNINYEGKYVNVDHSVRKSVPDTYISSGSADTIDIYFFGGSTMFGFNVADAETIPSQFVQQYKERYPAGKSVRVHNFATPTYYSYQELIQFANLFFKGHRPDIVIFLDGVNDFWFSKTSYYDQSYFSYILRQVFDQELMSTGKFQLRDSADKLFQDPTDIPLEQYNRQLIDNYYRNINNIKMMAELAGAKSYFFCQPVPFYNYPNQQNDPICFKDQDTRFTNIYPVIEKDTDKLPNFSFLGNMLEDEKGYPFVDGLHYAPAFIKKISARMLVAVEKDLR